MKKMYTLLGLVIVVLAVLTLPPGAAQATQPETCTVYYQPDPDPPPMDPPIVKIAGGNTIIYRSNSYRWTGCLEGDALGTGKVIIHANGDILANYERVFEGKMYLPDGRVLEGTITVRHLADGNAFTDILHCKVTVLSGTGDFENLRGEGTCEGGANTGECQMDYHFEP